MSEKRFYMDKSGDLYDKENGLLMLDFGYSYDGVNCKKIIELLNEQHEEIQQSKVLVKKYYNENTDLIKENEQLKSRIHYLERKIDKERISYCQKQHEKWKKELEMK